MRPRARSSVSLPPRATAARSTSRAASSSTSRILSARTTPRASSSSSPAPHTSAWTRIGPTASTAMAHVTLEERLPSHTTATPERPCLSQRSRVASTQASHRIRSRSNAGGATGFASGSSPLTSMSHTKTSSAKQREAAASSPHGAMTKEPPTKARSPKAPTAFAATIQASAPLASSTKQPSETDGAKQVACSSTSYPSNGTKQMTSAERPPEAKSSSSSKV